MRRILIAAAVLLFSAASAQAQNISLPRARDIALNSVPNHGSVKSEKLKTENGVQFYEFDIDTPGAGHAEVRVDARTGAVIRNQHEGNIVDKAVHEADKDAKKVAHEADKDAKKAAHDVDKAVNGKDLNAADYRISQRRATRIALRGHGGATVKSAKLDREDGTVVWKVKLEGGGKDNDHEVLVDANTGAVVEHKH